MAAVAISPRAQGTATRRSGQFESGAYHKDYVPIRRSRSRDEWLFYEETTFYISKTLINPRPLVRVLHCSTRRFSCNCLSRRAVSKSTVHPLLPDVIHRCLSVLQFVARSLTNAALAHFTRSVSSQRKLATLLPANLPSFTSPMTTTTTTLPPSTNIPRRPTLPTPPASLALALAPPPLAPLPPLLSVLPLLSLNSPEAHLRLFCFQMESPSSLLSNPLLRPPPC